VSHVAATAPEELEVPGTWNARDVGGRATPAGSSSPLRTGVLLRTASLAHLEPAGRAALAALGVRLVLDLRGTGEIERDGHDDVGPEVEVRLRPMDPNAGLAAAHDGSERSADTAALVAGLVGADDPAAVARRMMVGVYDTFVSDPGIRSMVGRVLTDLADGHGASVVHCSAGKDRTGWVVALVQHVCGIGADDRMTEYLASAAAAETLAATVPPIPGLAPDALLPLLSVEAAYLTDAWARAEAEFGSVDGYLDGCGAGVDVRARLRARLVA
jgi:protein-tyrosine phosphatase